MEGEEHICLHCSNHLPYTHFTDMETNPVCLLLQGKTSFVAATALLHFTKGGSGQKLIHSLKYHGNKKLGYELGHMAATTYRAVRHRRSPFAGPAPPEKNEAKRL